MADPPLAVMVAFDLNTLPEIRIPYISQSVARKKGV